jgi:hypothetical protein
MEHPHKVEWAKVWREFDKWHDKAEEANRLGYVDWTQQKRAIRRIVEAQLKG